MDKIGAEVGQKMRSAIKAKLMELGCYVDDELPDYVMVMVANKRSKSQMNDDLQLFLTTKTGAFVEWLQIVLKKLKEVTVTNPDIYKQSFASESLKRKALPPVDVPVKKEKKDRAAVAKKKLNMTETGTRDSFEVKSLTDDLPMKANVLAEKKIQSNRVVVLSNENKSLRNDINVRITKTVDSFDIPSLSEVKDLDETDLAAIEKKIHSVRKRVVMMHSDSDDDDFINIKAENDDLFNTDSTTDASKSRKESKTHALLKPSRKIKLIRNTSEEATKMTATTIQSVIAMPIVNYSMEETVKTNNESHTPPRKSVMQRLGKRTDRMVQMVPEKITAKKTKISLTEILREEQEILGSRSNSNEKNNLDVQSRNDRVIMPKTPRVSVLKRLGVKSIIARPVRQQKVEEKIDPVKAVREKPKSVASMVKIKPRKILPVERQANKTLLLKAVAEAQKSIRQTNISDHNKKKQFISDGLQTKKFRNKVETDVRSRKNKLSTYSTTNNNINKRLANAEISKLKKIVIEIAASEDKSAKYDEDSLEYIPKPVTEDSSTDDQTYIPSTIDLNGDNGFDNFTEDSHFSIADEHPKGEQRFIVTLDGFGDDTTIKTSEKIKKNVDNSRRRSPIIFKQTNASVPLESRNTNASSLVLPKVHTIPLIKPKERCKYYPGCRLGDQCDYIHPSTACKIFPQCKFGDKCLYIHPVCKFDASCTRRDCPYSHNDGIKTTPIAIRSLVTTAPSQTLQICKYYPNCSNTHCAYYHPKPCRFGKFCAKDDCNFGHENKVKGNLTWQRT